MKISVIFSLFILTISIGTKLHADSPLRPPKLMDIWSSNRKFCAVTDPKDGTTTVFRVDVEGKRTKSWMMPGWFRVADLANDGDHFVVGHSSVNLLPLDVTKDTPMIDFFKRGERVRTVTLGELFKDLSSLERKVSHYHWGHYLGLDENGNYVVETVEKRKLVFDVTTGKPLNIEPGKIRNAKETNKSEKEATSRLNLLRPLIKDADKRNFVIENLQKLLKDYPKTEAAAEAQKILKELQKC